MPLAKCIECGKLISTNAMVCPLCGKQRPTYEERNREAWLALGFLGFICMMVFVVFRNFGVW